MPEYVVVALILGGYLVAGIVTDALYMYVFGARSESTQIMIYAFWWVAVWEVVPRAWQVRRRKLKRVVTVRFDEDDYFGEQIIRAEYVVITSDSGWDVMRHPDQYQLTRQYPAGIMIVDDDE